MHLHIYICIYIYAYIASPHLSGLLNKVQECKDEAKNKLVSASQF